IEAARRILAASADDAAPAILILTTFGHDEYLFDALAAGVSGFLLKASRAEQLIDAVRTLARGEALLGPAVTRAVMTRAAASDAPSTPAATGTPTGIAERVEAHAKTAGLTEREREVLALVA